MGENATPNFAERARQFLGGEQIPFADADSLWRELRDRDELSLARMVLQRMRITQGCVIGNIPPGNRSEYCRQEAMLISKDTELNAATRHNLALDVLELGSRYPLDDSRLNGDSETLGIAGGICKRKWYDLGQFADLTRASEYYGRGASGSLGDDAYCQINAAFLDDMLAAKGDEAVMRRKRATDLRKRIIDELAPNGEWWNVASRAEAWFGLGDYLKAADELRKATKPRAPWQLQTTARQFSDLAHLHDPRPFDNADVRTFFATLLPGAADAVRSVSVGRIGLALSGGGFRASFFHLGVLAFLAERNILRNIDVLSCVSGGSIVGASYWLALRKRLMDPAPMTHDCYLKLVNDLIAEFGRVVSGNVRGQVQSIFRALFGFLGAKGAMSSEQTASALERLFYLPSWNPNNPNTPIFMHQLPFKPADHDEALTGSATFNTTRHNWLRANKVPALILNATTVNTGHAWQFTPTWMGEAPWSIYESADSVPKLQWANYDEGAGWTIRLGRAVAASACVPFVFSPLRLNAKFDDRKIRVSLVDGGVYDNQGTVSLLASNCNVLLVSDSCGQLMLEKKQSWLLINYAKRTMDTLMERVRLAGYGDLDARRRSGLLRGLMFLHMKSGLDADVVRLDFSQDTYQLDRSKLSPDGLRKDFQQALSELRTDLDDFSAEEQTALMACGYRMASKGFERDLEKLEGLWDGPKTGNWPFLTMLAEITSTAASTPLRQSLLAKLRQGSRLKLKLW